MPEQEPTESLTGPAPLLHRIHPDPAQIPDRFLTFGRNPDRGQPPARSSRASRRAPPLALLADATGRRPVPNVDTRRYAN